MNRADQAPEPSMEEILASIRLIISDDAKRSPFDDGRAPHPAALGKDASQEEEVLELTEELVFPEELPASAPAAVAQPQAAATPSPEKSPKTEDESAAAEEKLHAHERAAEPSPEPPMAAQTPQEPDRPVRQEPAREWRPEPAFTPPPNPSRTVWSRRELPGSPMPGASASSRFSAEPSPARPAQRSWTEDIQMPIPDSGPASLIASGETQAQIKEPDREPWKAASDPEPLEAPEALGEKEEAAVAALAESLARSAAGAMDEEELTTAHDVNFGRLDEERKAEVAESFAKAIEREGAPRERSSLPTLFDEVFRQGFDREPEVAEPAPQPEEAETAPAASFHDNDAPSKHEPDAAPEGEPHEATQGDRVWPSFSLHPAPNAPQPAEAPRPERHVAQAQFAGTLQPPPAASPEVGQSLEGAVREMLRPMLKQWLNENMPRILENAIREEIATRGILPKVDS